ncbi:MAG: hypothetical protein JWP58_3904 [Hymenobacter sp.]|nr:hypothetical protein [Hymenobacter sp.]
MSQLVLQPSQVNTRHRNVLQLGWTSVGTKSIEAVKELKGGATNAYYLVTSAGNEVLQTISYSEAQQHYDSLK